MGAITILLYLLAPNPLRSLRVQRVGDERFLVRYDRRGLDASEVTPGNGSESNRTTTGRSQQRVCNECDAPPLSYLHEPDGDEGDEGAAASMAESSEKKDENEGGDEKKDEKKEPEDEVTAAAAYLEDGLTEKISVFQPRL
ncbi:hypothetical protein AK812_SmicGene45990 [Symbiodinium microadriaticum]|uniref:Uncharacterized protein n=1 Tax=Symbiodinium microadriaticum TaxID=2951 RepID=A0A1Q9BV01_SYMMI|nr:hypothetical protein AK812_SmicGene45990 [Symbiodinium microadriaticum]